MNESTQKQDNSIPYETISRLLTNTHGLSLATISGEQKPLASYAPFIVLNERIYVYLSGLAEHTRNMLANQHLSLMLLAEPEENKNPFARQRLTLNATSRSMLRDTAPWHEVISKMTKDLGGTMQVLKTLPDFTLFELKISGGNFVKGFGAAFSLTATDWAIIATS